MKFLKMLRENFIEFKKERNAQRRIKQAMKIIRINSI